MWIDSWRRHVVAVGKLDIIEIDVRFVFPYVQHDGFQGHLSVELMDVDPDEVLPQYSEKLREYVAEVQPQEEGGETEVKVE